MLLNTRQTKSQKYRDNKLQPEHINLYEIILSRKPGYANETYLAMFLSYILFLMDLEHLSQTNNVEFKQGWYKKSLEW